MYKPLLLWICLLSFADLWPHPKPLVINIERNIYKAANKNWTIGQDEKGIMYFGNDIGLLESDVLGHYSNMSLLEFHMLPPWYRTVWAYILYIVAFCLLLYLVWVAVLCRYRHIHLQKLRVREARHSSGA